MTEQESPPVAETVSNSTLLEFTSHTGPFLGLEKLFMLIFTKQKEALNHFSKLSLFSNEMTEYFT